jgi:DNA invertase Pin-like site-specific DNA recombinase
MSDKIQPQHLRRKSQRLQYGMEERLRSLGWQEIEVIDENLGRSAADDTRRVGFERMVADVCLGKVGAVAAREVSRFARNSREWQQLIEVCHVVDTLLVDLDTVYALRQSNDRLLLGLKGSLNEYELDRQAALVRILGRLRMRALRGRGAPPGDLGRLVVHFTINCGVRRDGLRRAQTIIRPRRTRASLVWRPVASGKVAKRRDQISNQMGGAHDC